MTLKQIFIQNLKEFRKKEGLSQMKLADYCGTAHSYIGEIEVGRKFPSMDLIEKIATILRIEPYLFFKSRTGNSTLNEIEQVNVRMPHSSKKQLQKQVKAHIKKQVNQSTAQILSEINDIIEQY
ncbi:MAG: helix-turn-helix transcriptional regulator [Treponema sp.]|jgi:transcriptional regulator with XRE-family HTH domain|nr:helix-turn-helix transcriptional regulator [Treponema sp.]